MSERSMVINNLLVVVFMPPSQRTRRHIKISLGPTLRSTTQSWLHSRSLLLTVVRGFLFSCTSSPADLTGAVDLAEKNTGVVNPVAQGDGPASIDSAAAASTSTDPTAASTSTD